jgi:hypothetical protein
MDKRSATARYGRQPEGWPQGMSPQRTELVARRIGIPPWRCYYWTLVVSPRNRSWAGNASFVQGTLQLSARVLAIDKWVARELGITRKSAPCRDNQARSRKTSRVLWTASLIAADSFLRATVILASGGESSAGLITAICMPPLIAVLPNAISRAWL